MVLKEAVASLDVFFWFGLLMFISGIALSAVNPYLGIIGIVGGGIMGLQAINLCSLNRGQGKIVFIFLISLVTVMVSLYVAALKFFVL
ncbi:hypothetical protein [Evansella clarkii]|uniref:hypothetical protein n=1 Tax=Evansella clarkii TaxID=79879 RepID=UPI0009976851|nr:hypothetical protein [Evansella clarkii]